jgi:hypothetical protein
MLGSIHHHRSGRGSRTETPEIRSSRVTSRGDDWKTEGPCFPDEDSWFDGIGGFGGARCYHGRYTSHPEGNCSCPARTTSRMLTRARFPLKTPCRSSFSFASSFILFLWTFVGPVSWPGKISTRVQPVPAPEPRVQRPESDLRIMRISSLPTASTVWLPQNEKCDIPQEYILHASKYSKRDVAQE